MQGHERSKEIAFVSSSAEQQVPVQLYERTSGQTVALKAGVRSRAQQPTASTPPQPRHINNTLFLFPHVAHGAVSINKHAALV